MIRLRLSEAAALCSATLEGADVGFAGVGTDTRAMPRGALFIALRGPNFDGHDYVGAAREQGAAAAMVSRAVDVELPCLRVADTRLGLGALAAGWRARHTLPVVAVTGSNGKTTVKEMVAAVLGAHGRVLANRGNLNNDIGLPLTLLELDDEHRFAVLEMGANHAGEIATLCRLARPDVGVVTLCAPAHLEGFGSVEGVARAKGELFQGLPEAGIAVLNADDAFAPLWRELAAPRRVLGFGFGADADVRGEWRAGSTGASLTVHAGAETVSLALQLPGRHNAANALAACAVAVALGIPLAAAGAALEAVPPVAGRLQVRRGVGGVRIIDDSYNANPCSLQAALDVLAAFDAPRHLVLGDMAELGDDAARFHAEAGHAARAAGVTTLHALGDLTRASVEAFGTGAWHHGDLESLLQSLRSCLGEDATVLVKGSRSMRMERVVAALTAGETH